MDFYSSLTQTMTNTSLSILFDKNQVLDLVHIFGFIDLIYAAAMHATTWVLIGLC
jgi:hypothetical protein